MSSLTSVSAARNNAALCDAVCRAHGCETAFVEGLWINRGASPPLYPNAVTLTPEDTTLQLGGIRALLDAGIPAPWGVKDSFCTLDLAPLGFEVLFAAEWVGLLPEQHLHTGDVPDTRWTRVASAVELAAWEAAWSAGMEVGDASAPRSRLFLPALLDDPSVAVLAAGRDGRIVAGLVANRSGDTAAQLVGVSNIFPSEDRGEPYRGWALAAARRAFPGLPMVGYERGVDLASMRKLGFEVLGPLRIWLTKGG